MPAFAAQVARGRQDGRCPRSRGMQCEVVECALGCMGPDVDRPQRSAVSSERGDVQRPTDIGQPGGWGIATRTTQQRLRNRSGRQRLDCGQPANGRHHLRRRSARCSVLLDALYQELMQAA